MKKHLVGWLVMLISKDFFSGLLNTSQVLIYQQHFKILKWFVFVPLCADFSESDWIQSDSKTTKPKQLSENTL